MPNKNKQRGNTLERELVTEFTKRGFVAKRAWGSNGEAMGQHKDVDVYVSGDTNSALCKELLIQCKRRKQLPAYIQPSIDVNATVFRQDGKPKKTFIMFELDYFIDTYF